MLAARKRTQLDKKVISNEQFVAWLKLHKPLCNINHTGSSGCMEQQAALNMFSRSVETFGLRYRTSVSDGDSNTIKAIHHKSNPYVGQNVEKRECINHVGKRLGTALRNVVDTAKK
ncbi:hypothetical protein Bpfe_013194 [Biomphalaria pfeifferi]|uniref:Mutator-like transposase domain-containing protein n=1 Tax=Biomphalaria pfeifferi TaxID=112525 RepID=A0AAD8BMH1_BIOPF|nr:hypothetical protein Bpfe_013194 [Biomphalaria pfeifferi]